MKRARPGAAGSAATAAFVAVLLPWLVSRVLVFAVFLVGTAPPGLRPGVAALASWDGGWYVDIARRGYGLPRGDGQTAYPFFPLLPATVRGAGSLGLPIEATAVVVNHIAFLLGLWGIYALVERHLSPAAARAAAWSLALWPGSAPFSMVYPASIVLAASTWAFHGAESGRERRAGLLGAAAALARPNGLAVGLAAALASPSRRAATRVVLPAGVALGAWMAILWFLTGDPLVFLHAKAAWHEVTVGSLLGGREPNLPKIDLAAGAFAAAVLAAGWRRLPGAWLAFAALWLVPPLFLGILGMPRYVATCFPVFAAAGDLLARLPRAPRVAALLAFAAGLCFVAGRIASGRMVP